MSTKEPSTPIDEVQRQKYTGTGPVLVSDETVRLGEGPAHLPLGGEIGLENGISECGRTNGRGSSVLDDPQGSELELYVCNVCERGASQ